MNTGKQINADCKIENRKYCAEVNRKNRKQIILMIKEKVKITLFKTAFQQINITKSRKIMKSLPKSKLKVITSVKKVH